MMELCFGGRPLKFWRLLTAETFTDPRMRTKQQRTSGAYMPSEPWFGRFGADFLLVLVIVFTYQVIAPVVAVAGCVYFIIAEVVYSYNLAHVFWPMYESGGLFWYKLFRQVLVGSVMGQIALMGYMAIKRGVTQGPFLLPLPIIVIYFGSRWNRGERAVRVRPAVAGQGHDARPRGGDRGRERKPGHLPLLLRHVLHAAVAHRPGRRAPSPRRR
ncbi:unnamed protein product [Phaeothamnion confervicola]